MDPFGIIYLTSRVEGGVIRKQYVGQHRLRNGLVEDGYIGSGNLIKKAIAKYGKEAFAREVLELCYSQDEMNEAEKKWILFYSADKSDKFYNIAEGGFFSANLIRKKVYQYALSGEFIAEHASLADAAEAVNATPTSIGGACLLVERKTAHGFQWRFKKVKRLPPTRVKHRTKPDKRGVAVKRFDLEGNHVATYPSMAAAAKAVNQPNAGAIHGCCNLKLAVQKDNQWRYADHTDVVGKYIRLDSNRNRKQRVHQIDADTGKIVATFNSMAEGARSLGMSSGGVYNAVVTKGSLGGFLWQRAHD